MARYHLVAKVLVSFRKSDGFMRGDVRPWSAKVLALPSESDGFKKGGLGEAPSGSKSVGFTP